MNPLRCLLHARVAPLTINALDPLGAPGIELPEELLWAGYLHEFEIVEVVRESSGQFFTLPLAVAPGDEVRITGAPSRFFRVGDQLTLLAYTLLPAAAMEAHRATIVMAEGNRPIEIRPRRVRSMACHPSYLRTARAGGATPLVQPVGSAGA